MNAPILPGRIEHWPLARLKPYARNAKTHDADQVAKIAASMAEFGWTVPVLVAADGELIAGHGRVLAAAHLGLSEAPVIILGHLTEAQRRAYRIADNKLTELGGWDDALLLQELQAQLAEDFDLGLIGIPEDELDALLHATSASCTATANGSPIGKDGSNGCAHPAGGDLAGMSGIRAPACPATGTVAWPRHTSSFSTSTAALANRTKPSRPNMRAKPSAAVDCAGPTAPCMQRPAPATRSRVSVLFKRLLVPIFGLL